ncbi:MAG: PAS domain-containing protein, partial [Roseiarcus sp.]
MPTLDVLFESVFDALDCGIVVLDNQQRVVGWNAWLQSTSEIGVADALGKRIEDIFAAAPVRRVKAAIAAALSEGSPTLLTHSLNPRIVPLQTRAGQPLIHNLLVGPLGPAR